MILAAAMTAPLLAACGTPATPTVDLPNPIEAVENVADATVDLAGDAVDVTVDAADDVVDGAANTLDQAADIADQAGDAIVDGAEAVTDTAGDVVEATTDAVGNVVDATVDVAGDAVDATVDGVEKAADVVAQEVKEVIMPDATYVDYSSAAVDTALAAGQKVVLFFHASRCPSCRSADKDITANVGNLPDGVVVFKVDYDSNKDLRKQYKVTGQHTFVEIDTDKKMIASLRGGDVKTIQKLFE